MSNVTVQNKSELGMNRNDFYEYKKARMVELVSHGEGVTGIASDLGMDEKGVYAFISRNFGGLRNLKSMVSAGTTNLQTVGVLASAPKKRGRKPKNAMNAQTTAKKSSQKIYKSPNVKGNKTSNLSEEKKKIMSDFKSGMDKEIQATLKDIQGILEKAKTDIISQFKSDVMRELSAIATSMQ